MYHRLLKYFPPRQLQTAELLLRQNNPIVRSALSAQDSHLHALSLVSAIADNPIAWMHFYNLLVRNGLY